MQNVSVEQFEDNLKYRQPMLSELFTERNQVFTLNWRGQTIAIKMAITVKGITQLNNEVAILKNLSHPNIVTFYVHSDKYGAMGLEYLDDNDLCNVLNLASQYKLSKDNFKSILYGVASGLAYLHNQNIVFHDLKLENIFLGGWLNRENMKVKIGDFGCALQLYSAETERKLNKLCGSPEYLAPEMITGNWSSTAVDVYSYGCVVYELTKGVQVFTGTFPEERQFQIEYQAKLSSKDFDDNKKLLHRSKLYDAVKSGLRAPWIYGEDGPPGLICPFNANHPEVILDADSKDLISACWQQNPRERLSTQDILAHRFFRGVNQSSDLSVSSPMHAVTTDDVVVQENEEKNFNAEKNNDASVSWCSKCTVS